MTPEERDLISGLFGRLQQFESQPRDPEVERLIANLVARQSSTPYLLTQTVLVQEQALKGAQARIAELEAKVGTTAAPSGFLASAPKIGPWGAAPGSPATRAAAPAPQYAPQQQQPWGGGGGGGGFMRTALMTAAGVAGGALLFEGIRNMMGHTPGPFSGAQTAQTGGEGSGGSGGAENQTLSGDDSSFAAEDSSFDSGFDGGGSDDSF